MDFLKFIKTISDEELYSEVYSIIDMLEKDSKEINEIDFLGFNLSTNLENYRSNDSKIHLNMRWIYDGYIPKDTKIVYGFSINNNGLVSNKGMYYKVDDDSYIYDFCKYIRNINVVNEEDFFEYVLIFLMKYFGTFKIDERDDMFKLILKDEKTVLDPIREHKLSDFKGKGNALCSEYSIMANNILNVFDIYSCVFFGQLEFTDKEKEGHAFNFVSYDDKNSGKRVDALVDFSNGVSVYDYNYKKIGDSPYIVHCSSIENAVHQLICDNTPLTGDEYYYMVMGNTLFQLTVDKQRNYSSCANFTVKVDSKVKQK